MDYDSQISLALHMSEEEVKKEEYRMMVDDILQEMEKDMHAQVLTQPDQSDAGTASGAQPRSRSQEGEDFLGKGADGLKEDAHHYEWLEDIEDKDTMESEKEEAEAETYLWYKEQEDLELAMAMSLSVRIISSKLLDEINITVSLSLPCLIYKTYTRHTILETVLHKSLITTCYA